MEELSMSLFGDLPGSGATMSRTSIKTDNNISPSPPPLSSSSSSSSSSSFSSSSSTTSTTTTGMLNNNSTFHLHQQAIIADTIICITSKSCGQELQKDVIVKGIIIINIIIIIINIIIIIIIIKEKLHEVVAMLYNAIVGGEEFLNKCEVNKQKVLLLL